MKSVKYFRPAGFVKCGNLPRSTLFAAFDHFEHRNVLFLENKGSEISARLHF